MMQSLNNGGCVFVSDLAEAEVIVVNTCAFIAAARKEAVDTVLAAAEFKAAGACEKLIVTGCLPAKYMDELEPLYEADAFLGTADYGGINEAIERTYRGERVFLNDRTDGETTARYLTTPPHYAYLKIADGCDNRCAYCTIPSIRGRYKSRTFDSLVTEAEELCAGGVRELVLVAQDTTRYGTDTAGQRLLPKLVDKLSQIKGAEWIRIMYCYPESIDAELLETVAHNPKVCKYLDIPLQHINSRILGLMRRRIDGPGIYKLLDNIAKINDNICVRSSFIAGFPSETEAEFAELKAFVGSGLVRRAGFFAYSREAGTPAASMSGQIPAAAKKRRLNELAAAGAAAALRRNAETVGATLDVRYEGIDMKRKMFRGRSMYDAPDVDTEVFFRGAFADIGRVYPVKITGYDGYDLIGEIQGDTIPNIMGSP